MSRKNRLSANRQTPKRAGIFAVFAAFIATSGVSADTLAQPRSDALERKAAHYIEFRKDVAAIEGTPFDNAAATREAHRRLSAHDSEELTAGWVAYAALVAADTPAFAESLKQEMKKRKKRGQLGGVDGLISNLAQDQKFARKLDGADEAVNAVLAMTLADGARITKLGEAFKSQAYAMQKTKWGKQRIAPSQQRLNEADQYSRARAEPTMPAFARAEDGGVIAPSLASATENWDAAWGQSAGAGRMTEANAEIVMDRVLNLAARYSANKLNTKIVDVYAKNTKSERCLSMAKLTLNQCIAATRTPYEEAFCLGEHGLKDIATCTGWVAGAGS